MLLLFPLSLVLVGSLVQVGKSDPKVLFEPKLSGLSSKLIVISYAFQRYNVRTPVFTCFLDSRQSPIALMRNARLRSASLSPRIEQVTFIKKCSPF